MPNQKNQFARAEIKLGSKAYLRGLNLTADLLAKKLFSQIRNQNPSLAKHKWLVFYFDDNLKLRNWYAFNHCNPQTLKRVTGLAMAHAVEKIMVYINIPLTILKLVSAIINAQLLYFALVRQTMLSC